MIRLVCVASIALAACAHREGAPLVWTEASPESPTGWWELRSPHFTLYTDHSRATARECAEALEAEWQALGAIMGDSKPPHPRVVEVYVLADGLDFERLYGRHIWGFVINGKVNGKDADAIFMWGKPSRWQRREALDRFEEGRSALRHEMAHVVWRQYLPVQPRWFAEGIASYLETVAWNDDHTSIELGRANLEKYDAYRAHRSVGFDDVLQWDAQQDDVQKVSALYGYSWALMTYLINAQNERFVRYISALAATNSPDEAMKAAFTGQPGSELDTAVFNYMKTGSYQTMTLPVSLAPMPASLRPLTESERAEVQRTLEKVAGK